MVVPARLAWRVGRVAEISPETPRTKQITLDVPGWEGHRSGQHLDVRLTAEDGYQAQRSYSIASPPEAGRRLQLIVERLDDGEVSPYLTDELRPGDPIELRGPIGGYFTWDVDQGGPLLLVAGGSGVAPLLSMLRHRAAAASEIPARLLLSSRSYAEIIGRAELDTLAAGSPSLRVVHALTRDHPPDWPGYRRRIDADMLEDVLGLPEPGAHVFVCGPTRLVENVATTLLTLGYPAHRVKTERFGPTGG